MAALPTTGGSDGTWGTELNAFLSVGHNAGGTHNQEDWTPAIYAGEESITFPNGLIMKMGITAGGGTYEVVTFGTAFPTALVSLVVSGYKFTTVYPVDSPCNITAKATTGFTIRSAGTTWENFTWIAIGR